jgi:hypothetical protein
MIKVDTVMDGNLHSWLTTIFVLRSYLIFAFQRRIRGPNWDEQISEMRILCKEEFHSLYPSATTRVELVEMDHRYAHKILVKEATAEIYIGQ